MPRNKYKRILVDGHRCLLGNPDFRRENFYTFPVGTKFYKFGYSRNSSCREITFPEGVIYSGKITIEDTDYSAFKMNAIDLNHDKKYLFKHNVTLYMLFIAYENHDKQQGHVREVWLQDFNTLTMDMYKPLFEIDNNGIKEVVDLRSQYWIDRHSKPKRGIQ